MELAELRREEMNASSGAAACVPSSCVPCATQPAACFQSGFVLHEATRSSARRIQSAIPRSGDRTRHPTRWPNREHKPCLVLDLDETLVHSSFKPVPNSDFIVPVEIDGKMTDVYVLKRPWVDFFLEEVSKDWESCRFHRELTQVRQSGGGFTRRREEGAVASLPTPLLRVQGNYVKDLTCLGRDLAQPSSSMHSPYSYAFHPQNAFPISSFVDNPNDDELLNALPCLRQLARVRDADAIRRTRGCLPRQSYFSHAGVDAPTHDRYGNLVRSHAEMTVE